MFRPCFRKHRLFWKAQRSSNLRLDLPFASQDLRLGLLFAEINLLSTHGIHGSALVFHPLLAISALHGVPHMANDLGIHLVGYVWVR